MELPRQGYEWLARLGLHVGGVHDGQPPGSQPLGRDEVQHLKGVVGGGLIVLVVADQPAALVGGKRLGGQKMFACKRAFARAARADEHDECEFGNGEVHTEAGSGPNIFSVNSSSLPTRPPSLFDQV